MSHLQREDAIYASDLSDSQCDSLLAHDRVALDCETSGLNWRDDALNIIQIYAEGAPSVLLLRPTADRPTRLIRLLEDDSTEKVFHHACFDLRFLLHRWPCSPAQVRCTKVLSKLLHTSDDADHSLQGLLRKYCDISLDKGERLSDWSRSSLSRKQISYAENDVLHLFNLLDRLTEIAESRDRLDLAEQCFTYLPARVRLDLLGVVDVFQY